MALLRRAKFMSVGEVIKFRLRISYCSQPHLVYIFTLSLPSPRSVGGRVCNHIVCLSVCLSFRKFLGKLRTLAAQTSYWQTSNYTRIKNNNRLLLKPFGYKVMTIYITHSYCLQTGEDSLGQLDTSKHNCYCIMAIASKTLHQIKHN